MSLTEPQPSPPLAEPVGPDPVAQEREQVDAGHRFRIRCECGHELTGRRDTVAIRIRCGTCERPWLAIPRRTLELIPPKPEPPPKPRKEPRRRRRLVKRLRETPRRVAGGLWRMGAGAVRRLPWPRRRTLIAIGAVVVVGVTLYLNLSSRRQEELQEQVRKYWTVGVEKLEEGDLAAAHRNLREATAILPRLTEPHPDQRQIVQLAREVDLLANLSAEPLESLADQAYDSPSPENWQRTFESEFSKASVLLDCHVTATTDATGRVRYRPDYQIIGRSGQTARLDVSDLALFRRLRIQAPQRVIFLARFETMSLAPSVGGDSQPIWRLRLAADSGTLVTNLKAVEAAGLELDFETADLIRKQAAIVEAWSSGA